MFIKHFAIILPIISIFSSCGTQKVTLQSGTANADLIQGSISDFSKIGRLYKKDSVFVVWVKKLAKHDELTIVVIGPNTSKILLASGAKVGSKGKAPSRYLEYKGKLFLVGRYLSFDSGSNGSI